MSDEAVIEAPEKPVIKPKTKLFAKADAAPFAAADPMPATRGAFLTLNSQITVYLEAAEPIDLAVVLKDARAEYASKQYCLLPAGVTVRKL